MLAQALCLARRCACIEFWCVDGRLHEPVRCTCVPRAAEPAPCLHACPHGLTAPFQQHHTAMRRSGGFCWWAHFQLKHLTPMCGSLQAVQRRAHTGTVQHGICHRVRPWAQSTHGSRPLRRDEKSQCEQERKALNKMTRQRSQCGGISQRACRAGRRDERSAAQPCKLRLRPLPCSGARLTDR